MTTGERLIIVLILFVGFFLWGLKRITHADQPRVTIAVSQGIS